REMPALKNQIYSYSKGHVAYHLTTAINDGDMRGFYDILVRLPRWRIRQLKTQVKRALTGRERYPFSLIVAEVTGNMAGPYALWKSRQRVKELGRSPQYVPPAERQRPAEVDTVDILLDEVAAN